MIVIQPRLFHPINLAAGIMALLSGVEPKVATLGMEPLEHAMDLLCVGRQMSEDTEESRGPNR